ncbi:MAG: hypothetical protein IJX38_01480 [Clostridia bacterium]|nr:hypothetical protein [Clostridia bacterium]
MLYKKNKAAELSDELFKEPTSEYRGTPFWSWNCELDEKELLRQIDELKSMGFGGFHMHCRAGMSTEYLSDDFMALIKSCVRKAKREDMLAWLYDEDRWPSGFAGGIVTRDEKYRGRFLVFSPAPPKDGEAHIDFGMYDVTLDGRGALSRYRRISDADEAEGSVWYAYEKINTPTPRFNNQTYVDTLNPEAIGRFIEVTHEAYKSAVGREFDKTVPAIFTDEPQFVRKQRLSFATSREEVILPWTDDLDEGYTAEYGESLLDSLPELLWDLPEGGASVTRYRYHAFVGKRFTESFADQCGKWCEGNGIALTGHMMEEPTLYSQTCALGEAMPSYRGFRIPGIDILCAAYEFNTAKQCQSAVRQYGREAMLSELYGVTTWDFDFRGYKLSGDWQAAMGVTVRVPHLAWVSMKGEAKRDYPAAIGYQSPWFKKFKCIEDHFSRLNTAMTRGRSVVHIGVIHPIESYWLHWGPREQSEAVCSELDTNFENVCKWLSFGGFDFDYICETTLPELCKEGAVPLSVGKMKYDVVIVPACETLRRTTLDRLAAFQRAGGKLIFMGATPTLVDAVPSSEAADLYAASSSIPFSRTALLGALEEVREVELRTDDGAYTDCVLHQLREDGTDRWLFICNAAEPYNKHISRSKRLHIRVKGEWSARLYDTLSGDISEKQVSVKDGFTYITVDMFDYDSFLFRLSPATSDTVVSAPSRRVKGSVGLDVNGLARFSLTEPNALLLDVAEYSLDGEPYKPAEEILRADTACRKQLGWPTISGGAAQPWCIEKEPITHSISLRFKIKSELRVFGAMLAIEDPEKARIYWNGKEISGKARGYYVDRSIKTVRIPVVNKGENILEVTLPFGKRTTTEWCYLLGSFGVRVTGSEKVIVPLADSLGYGSILHQTLPFYSGAVDYHLDLTVPEECDGDELTVTAPQYKGSLIEVLLDGEEKGEIIYPPYRLNLGSIASGEHTVTLRLFVPRTNGFGPVHLADEKYSYPGPISWRVGGDSFGYEYHLYEEGIMMKPTVECVKYED